MIKTKWNDCELPKLTKMKWKNKDELSLVLIYVSLVKKICQNLFCEVLKDAFI